MSDKDATSDTKSQNLGMSNPTDLSFHPNAERKINEKAADLIQRLQETPPPPELSDSFPTELPNVTQVDFEQLKERPTFGETDISGRWVARYFFKDGRHFGIKDGDYALLRLLSEQIAKVPWVKEFVGQSYVEDLLFIWCREQFLLEEKTNFTDFLSLKAKSAIKFQTVYIPIALLEIEKDFTFGSVEIISLTSEMIRKREQACISMSEKQVEETTNLFKQISNKIQGLAAVSINIWGENSHVQNACHQIAMDAIGLLRLYSSAAYTPWLVCPCNVLGSEVAPMKTIMLYSAGHFSFTEGSARVNLRPWRLSCNEVASMRTRGLDNLSRLMIIGKLSRFQERVRSCLLTYSKGTTSPDLSDRLVYTFSALESLLLKDSNEPLIQNLGERMAFLIRFEPSARQKVVKNVKDAYILRSKYIHHQIQVSDEGILDTFILNARETLDRAINNMDAFPTQIDFIAGIDDIKFGH